uniref:Uncharacterized protein n=1 Tax=Alexandrium monilatum TaxID=311494 RepID=A0A7S4Q6Y7_9DINO|mmetsp:Transcript_56759/g.168961  ORF Transcript_56759/g.168961 Transcript_56759/m.168961 type:complete len:175 (-) Transcript_56759:69-593(-)
MAAISQPVDYLPFSMAHPVAYPELKDPADNPVLWIDVRAIDVRAPRKGGFPYDERYLEGVYVDGENGPMKLELDGSWRHMQHDFRCDFAKRNQLALHTKRWTTMSQSEKEAWLHITAKRNWNMRGRLDPGHPEYRARDGLPGVGEALALLESENRRPPLRPPPKREKPRLTLVF